MSLNGLDDASIKEAHEAAAAELGGWFLLKYTSRDEVGLLGRGTGGIVEIRNAVAQYEEPTPLYGFLRYRRRNVLISYIPEDCSRLIKARSTVHFNAVTERFSPHDTVFPITTAKELRDLELSAACSLHTASGSTSSSTSSLRRRRLVEIAEDEEEDSKTKRQSTVLEELASAIVPSVADGPPPSLSTSPPPSIPDTVGELPSPESLTRSPTKTIDEPRKSSQSSRPDLYSYSSYGSTGKPKVKLGPRPSLDVGGRPHTSSATSQYRPVSTLPPGLKLFSKTTKAVKERPKSQYNVEATSMLISPPPIPESGQGAPARPHTSGGRPSTSSGASIRASGLTANAPKSPTITPEKARLMKALQLRKKQMKTTTPSGEHLSPTSSEEPRSASTTHTASPLGTSVETSKILEGPPKDVQDTLAMLNDMTKEEDSAVAFDASSAMKAEGSDATRTDSYPVSPTGNSEKAESSKASSLSESTEETVQGEAFVPAAKEEEIKEEAPPSESEQSTETLTEQVQTVETAPDAPVVEESEAMPTEEVPIVETATTEEEHMAPQIQEPKEIPDENTPGTEQPTPDDATHEPVPNQELEQIPEVAAAEETIVEKTAPTEHEPKETVPEEPAPSAEDPFDHLPHLLPVTYQPPPSAKEQKKQEEAKKPQELPEVESIPASEETVPETTDAPRIITPASPAISAVGSKEPQTPADSNPTIKEHRAEALSELKNHNDSPISTKAVGEKTLKPKKSLVIATENTNSLLPTQPSPLLPKSPVEVEIKEWRIPRSKFSIPDLKAAAASTTSTEPLPVPMKTASLSPNPKSPSDDYFSADTRGSGTSDDARNGQGAKRKKRAGLVEPIRTDLDVTDRSHAGSEANFSSDDDLMDELQSAVVQEAKPISVSKSPMTSHFPTPDGNDDGRFLRASSNPLLNDGRQSQFLSPLTTPNSGRSVSASASYMNSLAQQSSRPIVKKVNLGSGISQRIKALEKLSKAAPAAETPPATSSSASATFFSVRRASVRNSKAPSIVDRTNSLTRNNTNTPSPPTSQNSSPEALKLHNRSESVQSRVDALAANPSPVGQRQRPESISVTARIIRDPNHPYPAKSEAGKNPLDYTPLDLKQSPLVIDHKRRSPGKEPFDERLSSSSSKGSKTTTTLKDKRSSMTVMKDFIKEGRASFSEHRRSSTIESSGSSVLSPGLPPSAHSVKSPRLGRSPSISSRKSGRGGPSPTRSMDASPTKEDGKSNRASRLLRRMSSSMSSSRKNLINAISPTLREESEPPIDSVRDLQSPTITSINIGDVNVQFPDTLLWKRRFVMLDSQGYLIISPALSAKAQKHAGATRRMHLSEFRTPMIPDVEMQELPNSVVLDFIEGSGLQIACEDRGGQARILNILQDAHITWVNNGP